MQFTVYTCIKYLISYKIKKKTKKKTWCTGIQYIAKEEQRGSPTEEFDIIKGAFREINMTNETWKWNGEKSKQAKLQVKCSYMCGKF